MPAAFLSVNQVALLYLVEERGRDEQLHHAGRLERFVLVDADQFFAGGEIVDRPGGAFVFLDPALPAQAADVILDGRLQVPGTPRVVGGKDRSLLRPTVVERLPIPRGHRDGGFQAPGLQQTAMHFRDHHRPGTSAAALVHQAEQIAPGDHLEPAGHFRPEHGGNAVPVGLHPVVTPGPEVGDIVANRCRGFRNRRRQPQEDGGRDEEGARNDTRYSNSIASAHFFSLPQMIRAANIFPGPRAMRPTFAGHGPCGKISFNYDISFSSGGIPEPNHPCTKEAPGNETPLPRKMAPPPLFLVLSLPPPGPAFSESICDRC